MQFGSVVGQLSPLQFARIAWSGHRVSVPVRPSQTVFAQYRHISGTLASSGQRTVPLSRIQLLNSLIDNLQRIKKDSSYSAAINDSGDRTDHLIEQYAAKLHQAMKSIPDSFGTPGGTTGAGMVFNVSA